MDYKRASAGMRMKEFSDFTCVNFQKELDKELAVIEKEGRVPSLLLHSCCAPCSSYCLTYLAQYFYITVDYYNPNIYPPEEFRLRAEEQKRLIGELPVRYPVQFAEGLYEPEKFFEMARGLETAKEGGRRCFLCYELRLREAAQRAKEGGFDYFTTTLSISPLKNAAKLNEIGCSLSKEFGVAYLYSDFKKKNGYKQSVELSARYHLYRQNYCGCVFSRAEAEERGVH